MTKSKGVPEGFHSVTPHLHVPGAAKAIDFYKKAFGAEEIYRMPSPDGRIMHAEIRIGDSVVMLADEFPEMCPESPTVKGNLPAALQLYVADCDAVFQRAVDAGAQSTMPPQDMFWGDRWGTVRDPFGHNWWIATRVKNLTPEEIGKAAKEAFAQPAKH